MIGVILGFLLLALLIALVVVQGMMEWGNFDFDKFFAGLGKKGTKNSGKTKDKKIKAPVKKSTKPARKKG
ncbi:MAG: hypothetical protein WCJ46_05280 [bacterium]